MSASKVPTACLRLRNRFLLLALACSGAVVFAQSAHDTRELDVVAGKALFERTWVTAPASTAGADGLGPYYDARSCAACHPGGGSGAVPETLVAVVDDAVYGHQLQRRAVTGLPAEATLQFSYVADAQVDGHSLTRVVATVDKLQYGKLAVPLSLRRPPSLIGVARFAEVSDTTLHALADPADANGDGISGRVASRYGWKAEVATLEQQVGKAFSVDLGLSNSWFPANAADCTTAQQACINHGANATTGNVEEADRQVLDLVTLYLTSLEPPMATSANEEGLAVFEDMQCAACHVAELETATTPLRAWTDLLLHDLGAGLAVGTNDALIQAQENRSPEGSPTPQEWRTAPLWDLGKRAVLLHDGRARTIEEAILWHGGEAEHAREKFAKAGEDQRQRLQAFLLGL